VLVNNRRLLADLVGETRAGGIAVREVLEDDLAALERIERALDVLSKRGL
jgi:hypothetical protein